MFLTSCCTSRITPVDKKNDIFEASNYKYIRLKDGRIIRILHLINNNNSNSNNDNINIQQESNTLNNKSSLINVQEQEQRIKTPDNILPNFNDSIITEQPKKQSESTSDQAKSSFDDEFNDKQDGDEYEYEDKLSPSTATSPSTPTIIKKKNEEKLPTEADIISVHIKSEKNSTETSKVKTKQDNENAEAAIKTLKTKINEAESSEKIVSQAKSFRHLMKYSKFKLDIKNFLYQQDNSENQKCQYSIIYRNHIYDKNNNTDGFFYTTHLLNDSISNDINKTINNNHQTVKEIEHNSSPESICLFFIHGVGGNLKIWHKQYEFFTKRGFEIVAFDLIGHGGSCRPADPQYYRFISLAQDTLFLFDLFARKTNIVIGHSYGCSFATYLSQNRKSLIQKIVLINGGSPHPLDYKSPFIEMPLCCIQLIRPCINCRFFW
jgi:hypothetical protein